MLLGVASEVAQQTNPCMAVSSTDITDKVGLWIYCLSLLFLLPVLSSVLQLLVLLFLTPLDSFSNSTVPATVATAVICKPMTTCCLIIKTFVFLKPL